MHAITLPQNEKAIPSVTVRQWLKAEGESVEKGDLLVRLEAERALVEVQALHSGTLEKILATPGVTVAAGQTLARMALAQEIALKKDPPSMPRTENDANATAEAIYTVFPILMPQAGQSMEEGTILKWLVAPGDRIEEGQIIFEIETDKANIEVEADRAGRLARIVAFEDDIVAVKVPVAYLAENDADVEAYLAAHASESVPSAGESGTASTGAAPSAAPAPSAPKAPAIVEGGRVKASPAARRIAAEQGVDLHAVGAGRGPGGRILSSDVEGAAQAAPGEPVRRRMSGMRRAIARNLLASKQTVPHFYMRLTVDAAPMLAFHAARKAQYKCSLNDVIVAASARTIHEFPAFRSRVDGDDLIEFPTANIGIAVGMDDGLVVPVVVGADRLSFERLASETRRVVEAARSGKIEGMGQGVFTISNLGMFGVEEFSAIINPPEAAILAVSAVREDVVVVGGAMRAARVMTMTLSCDHRVVDGLAAAKFLARFKELLEAPEQLG